MAGRASAAPADCPPAQPSLLCCAHHLHALHAPLPQTLASPPPMTPPPPSPLPALVPRRSAPMLTSALRRSLHWGDRSPVYRAWHVLDRLYLQPWFGGRAPQPAAYRSPPPSPGQQMVQDVLGPALLKRLAPAQEPATGAGCDCPPPGPAAAGADGEAGIHAQWAAVQAQAQAQRPPSPLASRKSGVHAQAFGLWPATSDDVSGSVPSRPATVAATVAPSVLSVRPDAAEMQTTCAVEGEIFTSFKGGMAPALHAGWRSHVCFCLACRALRVRLRPPGQRDEPAAGLAGQVWKRGGCLNVTLAWPTLVGSGPSASPLPPLKTP